MWKVGSSPGLLFFRLAETSRAHRVLARGYTTRGQDHPPPRGIACNGQSRVHRLGK